MQNIAYSNANKLVQIILNEEAKKVVKDIFDTLLVITPVKTGYLKSRWNHKALRIDNDCHYAQYVRYDKSSSTRGIDNICMYITERFPVIKE